ncbi:solute carrier family 35 member f2 [Stylonychia lemnae]|uniref:Solute carrier family 35 member f2 n=1 Tax=Stylonychia lemnae TaxID=5949 RepID=A0A077ZU56_STYLE|nr:solute carrier family 35 member f2 [Stylonychia lemnae]|eukprot:CDW73407.1 solute carrier family 35 member f2 [Stylonychia lemnae]
MLLQVFSIPSALFLSIFFLKIKYRCNHYLSLLFCAAGVAFSLVNDIILNPRDNNNESTLDALYGDIMVLCGAFLYATQEYKEFNGIDHGDIYKVALYYFGFAFINFVSYTIIPFFVRRSGATLLNISNLTTIIWSMLSDIFLFNRPFYWMYVCAFGCELVAILVYSIKNPITNQELEQSQQQLTDLQTSAINKSILQSIKSGNIATNSPKHKSSQYSKSNNLKFEDSKNSQANGGRGDGGYNSSLLQSKNSKDANKQTGSFKQKNEHQQENRGSIKSRASSNYDELLQDQIFGGAASQTITMLKLQDQLRKNVKEHSNSLQNSTYDAVLQEDRDEYIKGNNQYQNKSRKYSQL